MPTTAYMMTGGGGQFSMNLANRLLQVCGFAQQRRLFADIDVDNATLPMDNPKECGAIRLFTDGGYTLHERTIFRIIEGHKNEVWMQDAEYGEQRLKGLISDHRNKFTKRITTSKIEAQSKVGEINRFETDDTTYLVYDRDLEQGLNEKSNFWDMVSDNLLLRKQTAKAR